MFEQITNRFAQIEITGPAEFCCPGDVIATTADRLPVKMVAR
jgi:hypothetical protein